MIIDGVEIALFFRFPFCFFPFLFFSCNYNSGRAYLWTSGLILYEKYSVCVIKGALFLSSGLSRYIKTRQIWVSGFRNKIVQDFICTHNSFLVAKLNSTCMESINLRANIKHISTIQYCNPFNLSISRDQRSMNLRSHEPRGSCSWIPDLFWLLQPIQFIKQSGNLSNLTADHEVHVHEPLVWLGILLESFHFTKQSGNLSYPTTVSEVHVHRPWSGWYLLSRFTPVVFTKYAELKLRSHY